MAPRRPRKSTASTSPPPPSQHDPSHPANLRRSLARNDAELAALAELNKALRALRDAIVRDFGEEALIEIATGKNGPEATGGSERLRRLSSSFSARMRLRRRLLNRLSRRLYRVAYIMDGKDVAAATPPLPPLYGDEVIRFKTEGQGQEDFEEGVRIVEEEEVKDFMAGEEKREGVRRKVGEVRRKRREELEVMEGEDAERCVGEEAPEVPSSSNVEKANPTAAVDLILRGDAEDRALLDQLVEYDVGYDKTTVSTSDPSSTNVPPNSAKTETTTHNPIINTTDNHEVDEEGEYASKQSATERINFSFHLLSKRPIPPRERSAEWKRWTKELSLKIPEQLTFEDAGEPRVFDLERRLEDAKRKREVKEEEESPRGKGKVLRRNSASDETAEEDGSGEDKTSGDEGGEEKDDDEGINEKDEGAVSGVEESNDSEGAEEDAKVTAENESGSEAKGRVLKRKSAFDESSQVGNDEDEAHENVEEDQYEASNEEKEVNDSNINSGSEDDASSNKEEAEEKDSDGEDEMEVEADEMKSENEEKSADVSDKPDEEQVADAAGGDKAKIESKEIEVLNVKPPKRHNRTFSLRPVPSFYAQDMRRVELIQMELYQSSQTVNYQRRYEKAQAAYDEAFKQSMELQQKKAMAIQEAQKALATQETQLNAVKQKASSKIMRAKQVWEHRQRSHHRFRSANGEAALQIKLEVKDTLFRMVDRVCIREERASGDSGTKLTRNEIRQARASLDESQADRAVVANVLGHIVDSIERQDDEMLACNREFIPPLVETEHNIIVDPNTKETMAQLFGRARTQLNQHTAKISKEFEKAEAARAAAWSDVVKYKAMCGGDSAATKPKSKSRKSNSGGRSAPTAAPRAKPIVAQQMIPQQQFIPAQRSQPANIPVQMMGSANSAFAMPGSQRPNFNPVILQAAANANTASMMSQSANQSQPAAMMSRSANQPQPAAAMPRSSNQGQHAATTSRSANQSQPDGTVKMTQQEKYGYGDRYSLQNVAARKLNDGTVVPVTRPKMLPNGEYARPIGRQRKGMEWDALRGVWIPETGRSSMEE